MQINVIEKIIEYNARFIKSLDNTPKSEDKTNILLEITLIFLILIWKYRKKIYYGQITNIFIPLDTYQPTIESWDLRL